MSLVWDLSEAHDGTIWCVKFHPKNPNILVSCGADKSVKFWDISKKSPMYVINDLHKRTVRSIDFSPDGKWIAQASFDSTVSICKLFYSAESEFTSLSNTSLISHEFVTFLEGHESEVKCCSWSPSGLWLATASRDKSVWIWAVNDWDEFECSSILQQHSQDVKFVKWHPQKDLLFSTSYDNSIKIWSEGKEEEFDCIQSIDDAHSSTVWCIAFNSEGTFFVSCSEDGSLKLWKFIDEVISNSTQHQWICIQTILTEQQCQSASINDALPLYSITWKDDFIAVAGKNNKVYLFMFNNDKLHHFFTINEAHKQDVNCVSFSPYSASTVVSYVAGKQAASMNLLLASCSDDESIKLWASHF